MPSLGWLVLFGVAYYLYAHGGLAALGVRGGFTPATQINQQLPGGFTIGTPIPPGWRAYNLPDGSQVVIQANASTAPGGWVQAIHAGAPMWFNEQTGQMQ